MINLKLSKCPQLIGDAFQAPGVQKVDSAIHWINLYPVDSTNGFPNTHPLESDLFRDSVDCSI